MTPAAPPAPPDDTKVRKLDDLTEQEQRLIAADFAEHVLPLFEANYPDDDRPRKAIEAARAFLRGQITIEQLDAARAAAWAAARDAARAAERAWQQQRIDALG